MTTTRRATTAAHTSSESPPRTVKNDLGDPRKAFAKAHKTALKRAS